MPELQTSININLRPQAYQSTKDAIHELLIFWFGEANEADIPTVERTNLWFSPDNESDRAVKDRFSDCMAQGIAGELRHWEYTPRGSLALIILYDQMARKLFRHSAQAFTYEPMALDLCLNGLRRSHDQALGLIERAFFYMPMAHSESLHVQERSVDAFQSLVDLSMPELAGVFRSFLEYATEHYDIIRRFQRFPHRNQILGRQSTPDEMVFLRDLELSLQALRG